LGIHANSSCVWSSESISNAVVTNNSSFFRKPRLRVEYDESDQETFAPEITFLDGNFTQKHLKIRIRNRGLIVAQNCIGQLRVIIPKGANPTLYPSRDSKQLTWGRSTDKSDISNQINIHPIIGEGLLHIAFSDSRFKDIPIKDAPTKYASVSIFERLRINELRVIDSFSIGDFIVEVVVSSNEAHCKTKMRISIADNYRAIKMTKLTRFERLKLRLGLLR